MRSNEDCFLDDESLENYVPLRGVVSRCRFNQERGICLRNYQVMHTTPFVLYARRYHCQRIESVFSNLFVFFLAFQCSSQK